MLTNKYEVTMDLNSLLAELAMCLKKLGWGRQYAIVFLTFHNLLLILLFLFFSENFSEAEMHWYSKSPLRAFSPPC